MKSVLAILKGLWTSFKYLFRKKKTINFPKQKLEVSPNFRGQLALRCDENGRELCVACKLCEAVCPARAIKVEGTIKDGRRSAAAYEIDIAKCIYCGLCVQACPVKAVVHTCNYQFSRSQKEDLLYNKEKLLEIGKKWT